MALLNTFAVIGLSSFIVQVGIFVLLTVSLWFKRKQKFKQHGFIMAFATILHLILIFMIMVPSLVYAIIPNYNVISSFTLTSIISFIHAVTGALAATLGLLLVVTWHFSRDVQGCFNRKKLMLCTFSIWLVALILGMVLFSVFYGPELMS